jgi:hypothetical protein
VVTLIGELNVSVVDDSERIGPVAVTVSTPGTYVIV